MEFDYTVSTDRPFQEAVASVQAALEERGFRVQFVHDVQATLAERGFEREPLTIIETCNAKHAHAVLSADPTIALMLPCPVIVFEAGGVRSIATLKPTVIGDFYPHVDIASAAAEVERVLVEAIDAAR